MNDYFYYYKNRERIGFFLMIILMGFLLILVIPNDFLYIHQPWLLLTMLVFRGFNLVCLLCLGIAFMRNWSQRTYQILVLSLLVPVFLSMVLADLTRPSDYLFGFIFIYLAIAFYYFMLPASLATKTIPSILISIYQIISVCAFRKYPDSARLVIIVVFVGLNFFGVVNAVAMRRLGQTEIRYKAKMEDEIRFKQAMANSSFEAIVLFADKRILDFNQNFLALLDMPDHEVRHQPLDCFMALSGLETANLVQGQAIQTTIINKELVHVAVEIRQQIIDLAGNSYTSLLVHDRTNDIISQLKPSSSSLAERIEALPLSVREKQIVALILEGKSRYSIAANLFISDETVKKHTGNIYRKLAINSKVDLVRQVIEGREIERS